MRRWILRGGAVVLAVLVLTASTATTSLADDGSPFDEAIERYQNLYDSRGNHIDSYMYLSLYDGGTTGMDTKFFSWIAAMQWTIYANLVKTAILWLDWVASLGWKDFLIGPLSALSSTAQTVIGTIGLRPLMLTILAIVVTVLLIRRRTGAALSELAIGCLMAALAAGALANPMAVVAGPSGAISQAQEVGDTLSTAISTDGEDLDGSSSTDDSGLTGALIDTMLRTPHQLINYGQVIDGGPCEEVYDSAIALPVDSQAPAGATPAQSSDGEDARITIGECDASLQAVADNANPQMVWNILRLTPASVFFVVLSVVILLLSMGAVLVAGWAAVSLVWQSLLGIAPGRSRRAMLRSLGVGAGALAFIALQAPLVTVFMLFVNAVVGSVGGPAAAWFRFDLVGFFLLLCIIALIVLWIRLRRTGRGLADSLARLGYQSSSAPHEVPLSARIARGVSTAADAHRLISGMRKPAAEPGEQLAAKMAPRSVDARFETVPTPTPRSTQTSGNRTLGAAPTERKQLGAAPASGTTGGTPDPSPSGPPSPPSGGRDAAGAPTRLGGRLKQATVLAAHVGLAAATGGGSTAVTGVKAAATGAKAATAASKVAKARQVVNHARSATNAFKVGANTVRPAGRQRTSRTPRNDALRAKLRPVNHEQRGRQSVDTKTGNSYGSVRTADGSEVLVPAGRGGHR